jgi:crossover junction endodeoxyribonuclease RusA
MIEMHLPYPPSANTMWERAYKGMRLSKRYEKWLFDAGFLALGQHQPKHRGKYKLAIQAVRPDRKKRDLDNIIKPISDLLVSIGAIQDDSLCEMVTARWVTQGEGIYVRIEPVGVE